MKKNVVMAVLLAFSCAPGRRAGAGEPAKVKAARKVFAGAIEKAEQDYERKVAAAKREYEKKLEAARKAYEEKLNAAMKAAMKKGKLDEANAIREAKDEIEMEIGGDLASFKRTKKTFMVDSAREWQGSGVRVGKGEKIRIRASGKVQLNITNPTKWGFIGPEGRRGRNARRIKMDELYVFVGQLLLKIGGGKEIFPLGKKKTLVAPAGGELIFRIADNPGSTGDNRGKYEVKITIEGEGE